MGIKIPELKRRIKEDGLTGANKYLEQGGSAVGIFDKITGVRKALKDVQLFEESVEKGERTTPDVAREILDNAGIEIDLDGGELLNGLRQKAFP